MSLRISKDPNKNWENNAIQFPRLIAELEAAGVFTPLVIHNVCESMDLTRAELRELLERADNDWQKIKSRT